MSRETREALARLAKARGATTAELLGELVERAEQDLLLARMNRHYAAAQDDAEARAEIVAERKAWEGTLLDGLAPRS